MLLTDYGYEEELYSVLTLDNAAASSLRVIGVRVNVVQRGRVRRSTHDVRICMR